MSTLALRKVISALPGALVKSTVYLVRVGTGFDLYATNESGAVVAYPLNIPAWNGTGTIPVGAQAIMDLRDITTDVDGGGLLVLTGAAPGKVSGLNAGTDMTIDYGTWRVMGRFQYPWNENFSLMQRTA